MKRAIFLPLAGAGALLLSSCTCPFAKSPAARETPRPAATTSRTDAYSGRYAGTWQSEVTRHRGRLYCDLHKMDPKHYRADFKAHWGIFSGSYSVVMETRRVGRELRFAGRQDLGKIYGGVFRYEGKVGGGRLTSTYASQRDRGSFTLARER